MILIRVGDKAGYINAQGELLIPPEFEYGESRHTLGVVWMPDPGRFAANGLAAVKKNGKWGYINVKGDMVIPPEFEEASPFSANGLAMVRATQVKEVECGAEQPRYIQ
jgi:hypothetical protein